MTTRHPALIQKLFKLSLVKFSLKRSKRQQYLCVQDKEASLQLVKNEHAAETTAAFYPALLSWSSQRSKVGLFRGKTYVRLKKRSRQQYSNLWIIKQIEVCKSSRWFHFEETLLIFTQYEIIHTF